MIGFNHLGKNGRLGNQMFQCAGLLGIARYKGYDYCIPDHSWNTNYGGYQSHELQGCFKMSSFDDHYGYVDGNIVQLDQYHFCQELMDECPDNCTLIGYFESEKYFKYIEDEIKLNYEFKDEITEECLKYEKSLLSEDPVALTVRRGDFLSLHNVNRHKVCDIEYYQKALENFKDRSILIFSDDIPWCKEQELFKTKNIKFVEGPNSIYKGHFDLCLMTMCSDFIIANSTFSWWGAWLSKNKDKKVIAPKQWFGPELQHLIIDDQIPEEWERI